MTSFAELVEKVKSQIREVEPEVLKARQDANEDFVLLDIRERDEFVDGHIEGADFIPRGFLDMRIESTVPERSRAIVLYCAGGIRSALAARTLQELGYSNVESLKGGYSVWKERGFPSRVRRALSEDQVSRYSRHLRIPEIGEAGQLKLLDSKVLMLGVGGLGSPVALYLAAAGVGTLGLIDDDVVDRSNLQRQVIHTDGRIGVPKVDSAEISLHALNPQTKIVKFQKRLNSENIDEIFEQGWDAIVDGGDNFPTRYLVNDTSVRHRVPLVHGSVFRFEGQVSTFLPDGPCYRCLYPEPPPPEFAPNCQEAGVLGVVPGVVGLLQATEVIKVLLGIGSTLDGRILAFDALSTKFRELRFSRDPSCPVCGD